MWFLEREKLMTKSITRVNYDELQGISKSLHNESEEILRLHSATRQKMDALRGGWTGEAANAFFREQEGTLLPAVIKVSRALGDSETVLNQIMQIIRQADEETAGYFKGFESAPGAHPKKKFDWHKFFDGLLETPGVDLVIGVPIEIISDIAKGDDWLEAIFKKAPTLALEKLIGKFPAYMMYGSIITWLHLVSAQVELFGQPIFTPQAKVIFEIAKLYDPTLTDADQAVWFQEAAEWLDVRDNIEDGFINGITNIADENRIGPFIYIDVGPGTPFPSFSRSTPVAL
jgi:WXG100 family type VII secretion target